MLTIATLMENPVSLDKTGLVSYSDHIIKMTTMIT